MAANEEPSSLPSPPHKMKKPEDAKADASVRSSTAPSEESGSGSSVVGTGDDGKSKDATTPKSTDTSKVAHGSEDNSKSKGAGTVKDVVKSTSKPKDAHQPKLLRKPKDAGKAKGAIVFKDINKFKDALRKSDRQPESRSEPDDKCEPETAKDSIPESGYEPDEESEDGDLVDITVKGLRNFARENGVSFSRSDNRAKMIDKVRSWKKAHTS